MSIEYLGQVTNLVTCEELIELTNFTGGSSDSTGNITWGKILENGKIYLVSQALPKRNISFSALNSQGLIFGKTIAIGKDKYICRSMTGLNDDNSYGGEWSRWVIDLLIPQGMNFSNLAGRYRFTQDILNEKAVLVGYYNNSSTYTTLAIDSSSTNYSWSPVLELLPRCEFSINSEDLGNTFNSVCIKYVVLGDTHTLIEKINGTQIRTLDNQVSGTEHTLDLSQQWDNINYGSHTIEIIATDSNGLSSTVEITFNKIKEITKPIPITSSLKEFVNHIDNVGKDVDYLRYNLKNNLIKKGVECSDTDKMSNLIDMVNGIIVANNVTAGESIQLFKYTSSAQFNIKQEDILKIVSNVNGSVKIKINYISSGASGSCPLNIDLIRGVSVVSSKTFTLNSYGYYIDIEYDLSEIQLNDVISIYVTGSRGGAIKPNGGITISYDKL